MAHVFCRQCGQETEFVPIYRAMGIVDLSRSSIYYWNEKGWVHWIRLASGRRLICRDSLFQHRAESEKGRQSPNRYKL
ncbi:MAG: hypothetical protein ABIN58_06745 [candidate division WOR-3 bacterium]